MSFARTSDWQQQYLTARKEKAWLLGFKTIEQNELAAEGLSLSGRWPAELHGTLYRNMPARHSRGDQRYRHWFDGDGMLQAFRLGDGRVSHRGRFVETTKYRAEREAERMLKPAFGTRFPGMDNVTSSDDMNVANVNVIRHGQRLLALWDAGSAWELDPDTLETVGPVTWRDDLKAMPFSAHPRRDRDGSLWNFGAAGDRLLVLYHIDAGGNLKKADAIPVPELPFLHDFAITERHLIFLLPPMPLQMDRLAAGTNVLDSYQWQADQPMRVLTVNKDDWSDQQWYELPPGFVFHLGNAWEESSGVMHLDYVYYPDAKVLTEDFRAFMHGGRGSASWGQPARVTLHPKQHQAKQTLLSGKCEFPTLDPRYVGQRQRYLVVAEASEHLKHPGFNALRRIDLERETEQVYRFDDHTMVEEHVIIPKTATAGDGDAWLLGTALDTKARVTRLTLFDALHLEDGPIAQAALPYALPLGFHSHFVRT
ncbi:hypothetical protein CAI21_20620 [Alkalilimnicola ehrlichii]|uniref:carotenoid oxygenase family protein n=1 Tax=Alkalilimnicola ehrlichii TaxID=351052 RepID=UPI000E2F5298|nr:carotenoid oxygenase family protein [Alkalilimnicola ehrlichii]RFA24695.1 hypothetical protein CAI21_20620 [Alkalilimnicola ehrlichii]